MKECKICLLNDQTPGIFLKKNNICNICEYFFNERSKFNFTHLQEKKNLETIKKKILQNKKKSDYDCLIGVSGGLDSTYVAYVAFKMGLKALLITVDNGWSTILAHNNISKIIDYTKFDFLSIHLDWNKFKYMQKKIILNSLGDLEILTDHFIFSNIFETAKLKKIKTVLIGNNFICEHTNLKSIGWNKRDGMHIQNFLQLENSYFQKHLKLKSYLEFIIDKLFKINEISILNYINYNPLIAKEELKKKINFISYDNKHYESYFTKFFQGYYLIQKFGFDKRKIHLSEYIRNNYLSKIEAKEVLKLSPIAQNEDHEIIKFIKKKLNLCESDIRKIKSKTSDFAHARYSTNLITKILNILIIIYTIIKNTKQRSKNFFLNFKYLDNKKYATTLSFAFDKLPEGGAGTFFNNFINYFSLKKWGIFLSSDNFKTDFIFINNMSVKKIFWILKCKSQGAKIIQRIDGKKWIYKFTDNYYEKIYSVIQNFMVFIFQFLADKVIYQSIFIKKCWSHNLIKNKTAIIYNGSNFNYVSRPFGKDVKPTLISIEGNFDTAFRSEKIIRLIKDYKYEIYGDLTSELKKIFEQNSNVTVYGIKDRTYIKSILEKKIKYIFLSLEMYAPCPNSVIEALNSGIPVIGYNLGAMNEIVDEKYGRLINVNSKLEFEEQSLLDSINHINNHYQEYNSNLKNIDKKFSLDFMLSEYENQILSI